MDIVEKVTKQVEAHGKLPDKVAVLMHRDFTHWHSANPEGTIDDFRKVQLEVALIAKTLSDRGTKVVGVVFSSTEYQAWLNDRDDNPSARAIWSTEKATSMGGDWEWISGLGWVITQKLTERDATNAF